MSLTKSQISIVKSLVPVLKQHGKTITTTFYADMLTAHPELKNTFSLRNQQTGAQQQALANSVIAYAEYIEDLPRIRHAVERIAQKHISLFIQPEQYQIVGKYLTGAIVKVLGSAVTPEVADAWLAAYAQLADVFIKREGELYKEAGDWTAWRKFKIARKEMLNDGVAHFYLEPLDGKTLPVFLPGQYVSLQIPMPELDGLTQSRQYSLSHAPKEGANQYRVSIKLEDTIEGAPLAEVAEGKVPGIISNILHKRYNAGDEVELSPPCGEFFVDPRDASGADKPLVLLSAGVGAAPLLSIYDAVLRSAETAGRPIKWIHGARNSGSTCYVDHVRETAAAHDNVTAKVFLGEVRDGDKAGEHYDYSGRIDLAALAKDDLLHLADSNAEYYLCGPEDWMIEARAWLQENGVSLERLHLELFRTGDI